MLTDEAFRIAGAAAPGGKAIEGTTYGAFANGSARRAALSDGVEHIGVLYARESMAEALGWLDAAFGRRGDGFLDARGPWLGFLFLGLVALAWPLASLLPQATAEPAGAGLPWSRLLPVALAPPVLVPLALWKAPTGFLPILLGDYLTAHLALYGLLTLAGLWLAGGLRRPAGSVSPWALAAAALAPAAYLLLALGLPIDRYVASFGPIPARLVLLPAVLAGTLPYFLADEWLTRGAAAPGGAYALTKLLFLLSLPLAVTLSLERLFFLVIIVPAILVFFVVYGLLSGWAYRRTGHPLPAGAANAVALAWAIAATFPLVGGR